uniref:Poly(U)-specific endoribonuclease-B-like isoform X2 n=1 Tax=Nicotiana tabacum TaxID=4097 RepID=A0A1S4A8T8_TOBAC|nr:PREDICTED: poly(U)-specific endoribonuclease-B-like isoform X2 [Nicotiana tabacum]
MEGLVKGLLNVALGNDENDDRNNQSRDRDERSRSTWAQVVSGDQEDDGISSDRRHGYNREEERNEGWKSSESRPHKTPQKASPQGYERNDDERQDNFNQKADESNNDGWETVRKKPTKRHQKVKMDNRDNYKKPVDEQEYSNEVEYGVDMEPSDEELSDLSRACNKLWELDLNRLVPGKDYQIDCGEGKKVYQKEDMAEGCLFSWLSDDVFNKPTYSRFCSLLDNYNPHQGCKENVTPQEKQEQTAFIEEISRTAPIKYLHKYLSLKRVVSGDYEEFKRMMTHLWFDLYSRGGTSASSSAFEHVFVGEIKERGEKSVSGFHNWLQDNNSPNHQ